MKVSVKLHTILQRETPEGVVNQIEVELPEGSRLDDLLQHLEMELDPEALLLAVNGRMADTNKELKDGDEVNLMPAISGGQQQSRTSLFYR